MIYVKSVSDFQPNIAGPHKTVFQKMIKTFYKIIEHLFRLKKVCKKKQFNKEKFNCKRKVSIVQALNHKGVGIIPVCIVLYINNK